MTNRGAQRSDDSFHLKIREALLQLRFYPRVMKLVFRASKGWFVAWGALIAILGVLPAAIAVLTQQTVDAVTTAMAAGGGDGALWSAAFPAMLLGGSMLLSEALSELLKWVRENASELIKDEIQALIHDKSTVLDLSFYDNPDYYDRLHRARSEASYRPTRLIESTGSMMQSAVTLVTMSAVLFQFSPLVPAVLVLSTVPALFIVLRHALVLHHRRRLDTPDERRTWYYDGVLTSEESAAELRLFGLADYFKKQYRDTRQRLRRERLRIVKKQGAAEFVAVLIGFFIAAACLFVMGRRTLNGAMSLGELALFYMAFSKGQQMMRGMLGNMGDILRNILYLGDLFEFLDLSPAITNGPLPKPAPNQVAHCIAFEGVSFSYPGSTHKVLENFNLKLDGKSMAAVVGQNGSGKSTLIRLLCRFYDPQAGRITVDGEDLRNFSVESIRERIAVMFQEPVHYNLAVSENIGFGDLSRIDNGDALIDAAIRGGAKDIVDRLPSGLRTVLGKWFESGQELSVGEWQRIALSRAFFRRSPVILLDEPTSAMDSWAEAEWMSHLRALIEGRCALIITHRFTTAMRADIIHVMHGGRIVESGTHESLLALGGRYAASWREQMRQTAVSDKTIPCR